jgi:hypothetical protein
MGIPYEISNGCYFIFIWYVNELIVNNCWHLVAPPLASSSTISSFLSSSLFLSNYWILWWATYWSVFLSNQNATSTSQLEPLSTHLAIL